METQLNGRSMPFTEEQMQQIYGTNIIDLAVRYGFQIEKGDRNSVHVKHSGGLYLFNHGRGYVCFGAVDERGGKGNIVDFTMEYLGAENFIEAGEMILGCRAYGQTGHSISPTEKEPRRDLVLPPKARDFGRTVAYLVEERGIDEEIVYAMINQSKVYQAKITREDGSVFHNCAFVGYGGDKKPRYCALRSMYQDSSFRQDIEHSDKSYGFTMEGRSNRVYEFEAPIDAMSHAALCKLHGIDWQGDHRVAEGCLSDKALSRYLSRCPEIKEIVFCYDNDEGGALPDGTPHNHGQERAERAAKAFTDLGYRCFIQKPNTKDFNQDLITYHAMARAGRDEWER